MQTTIRVEGMSCGHCVKTVEEGLAKMNVKGKVDLAAKTVAVEFDEGKTSLSAIQNAIEDMGYDVAG